MGDFLTLGHDFSLWFEATPGGLRRDYETAIHTLARLH
jgi:hypothetical protein